MCEDDEEKPAGKADRQLVQWPGRKKPRVN